MPDLFSPQRESQRLAAQPLAARLRPRTLQEFHGQCHLVGPGKLMDRLITADRVTSLILWGPPGSGKTTLAEIIAAATTRRFCRAHAAMLGVAQLREMLAEARTLLEADGTSTILFLDEIHRFARNQQDALLHDVEQGLITLIGATTENPAFTVNNALISRSTVCRLHPLEIDDLMSLITAALKDERGFAHLPIEIDDDAAAFLARSAAGDARRLLTALEIAVLWQVRHPSASGSSPLRIDLEGAEQSTQQRAPQYDRDGDAHFDVASALIKSVRGSDVDASVYWLARMLEAGEDPRFIARRLSILASEDIGLADPHAMTLAASAWTIVERVGMPECQLTLSHLAIYLALAPKSNAAACAIWSAMEDVRSGDLLEVPIHLRDAHNGVSKSMGLGDGYIYPHDEPTGHVAQDHLGADRPYYTPTDRGRELHYQDRIQEVTRQRGPSKDASSP